MKRALLLTVLILAAAFPIYAQTWAGLLPSLTQPHNFYSVA